MKEFPLCVFYNILTALCDILLFYTGKEYIFALQKQHI